MTQHPSRMRLISSATATPPDPAATPVAAGSAGPWTMGALALAPAPAPAPAPRPRRHLHLVPDDAPAPAARVARAMVQLVCEALTGLRRVEQLRGRVDPQVRATIGRARRAYRGCPPPQVQRVLLDTPADGAIEVTAVVRYGARRRALALRLDLVGRRWRCTAMRTG